MFLDRENTGYPSKPLIWVLVFHDQHGKLIREYAGFDRERAMQRMELRRDQVRDGTYLSPERWIVEHELETGYLIDPDTSDFVLMCALGPQTIGAWILAEICGVTRTLEGDPPGVASATKKSKRKTSA